jgi:hypothetical protein
LSELRTSVNFTQSMLCSRLTDAGLLTDPRCIAEPKLHGRRA